MNDRRCLTGFVASVLLWWPTVGCQPNVTAPAFPQSLVSPAPQNSAQPHLARSHDGTVVLSWQHRDGDKTELQFATFANQGWQPARTAAHGNNWFVNWADFGSVLPLGGDRFAAHWLVKRDGGAYAYDVAIALSDDGGMSWSDTITPHDDDTPTEHGFVSLFPSDNGVGAIWLDGRNNTVAEHDEHHGDGNMTLRSAVVSLDKSVQRRRIIDARVCDCCKTDVAHSGDVPVAVYRDRSDNETRDIYVSRLTQKGWSPGVSVADDGWIIAGCPVNGPSIVAQGDTVVVAWFSGANDVPRVRVARSVDGGKTFGTPIDLDAGNTLGRVDVVLLENGDAIVSSLFNAGDGQGELRLRRVNAQGQTGKVLMVAPTSTARTSGFAQMIRRNDDLLLAWTDIDAEQPRVQVAIIEGVARAFAND